jgi:putative flippase GtrA
MAAGAYLRESKEANDAAPKIDRQEGLPHPSRFSKGGNLASAGISSPPHSILLRWCKFNLVGGIGIGVQFAALFLLKSVLHFNYLVATALAVEAALLHNFVWHEQFTWVDRTRPDRTRPDRTGLNRTSLRGTLLRCGAGTPACEACGAGALARESRPIPAALGEAKDLGQMSPASVPPAWRRSLARLVRFHFANGAVSLLGNLALMKILVGQAHLHYLVANAIAITLCSLVNFLLGEEWVFGDTP